MLEERILLRRQEKVKSRLVELRSSKIGLLRTEEMTRLQREEKNLKWILTGKA